jgi:hypothetical protein
MFSSGMLSRNSGWMGCQSSPGLIPWTHFSDRALAWQNPRSVVILQKSNSSRSVHDTRVVVVLCVMLRATVPG